MKLHFSIWVPYVLLGGMITSVELMALSQNINGHCLSIYIGVMALLVGRLWGSRSRKRAENERGDSERH